MCYSNIIGRKKEIEEFDRLYKSDKSEFVAIYGRRRVGKSYLVNEAFSGKIVFKAVGSYLKDGDKNYETYRRTQLNHFYDSLIEAGLNRAEKKPDCWREAFLLLKMVLQKNRSARKVVFLDELPWLAGPQSAEMVSELGYFWNSWADSARNIVLVVCGSATSWMLDNVIRDYGGLYGRLTCKIHLMPFTLAECEKYYKKKDLEYSRYEQCVLYMALGGIPYYLDKLSQENTVTDNIDKIFFTDDAIHQEFRDVYTGLYSSKEKYIDIVKSLGAHFYGLTQKEISDSIGVKSGGTLTSLLSNLKESGIIREYPRYGKSRVETVYQLADFFSLFYLRFVSSKQPGEGGWNSIHGTPVFYTWAGETFEILCMEHLFQIKNALRIPYVSRSYCWRGESPAGIGAQIDLVLESKTAQTDYLCEIKFSSNIFAISSDYASNLRNKIDAFLHSKMHNKIRSIQLIMITSMGLQRGANSSLVNGSVSLAELFED